MTEKESPMTEAMYYVLLTLVHPNHGYQLMTSINEISDGRITMGPGTLYGILTRMQKEKLIRILEDDGRRKTYKITEAGLSALNEEHNRLRHMVEDGNFLRGDI